MQAENSSWQLGDIEPLNVGKQELKALYQYIRAACYFFKQHLKPTAQCDVMRTQVQAVSLAAWHLPRPQLSIDQA